MHLQEIVSNSHVPESHVGPPVIHKALWNGLRGVSSHILHLLAQFENEKSNLSSYL